MNIPTRSQRLIPLTDGAERNKKSRKQLPLTAAQKNLQLELKSTWDLVCKVGTKLNAREMSRKAGYHQSLAGQYLNGDIALNTEAMLWFAHHMGMAPQEIWSTWRYGDLTNCPSLVRLGQRWGKLSLKTRFAIDQLAAMDDAAG